MADSSNKIDESLTPPKLKYSRINFTGDGGDYFKIWIVNTFLTIVTLGLYSPWAKIRKRKYLYQVTSFRGHRMNYHAKAFPILKGRIIVAIFVALYLFGSIIHPFAGIISSVVFLFLLPFLFVNSVRFNATNTSFKNIRFQFRGKVSEAYSIFGKYFALPILLGSSMMISILYFSQDLLNTPEAQQAAVDVEKTSWLGLIFFAVGFVIMVYFLFMASTIINKILSFFYNNLYYGGIKFNLESNGKLVGENITRPLYFAVIKFILAILVVAGGFYSLGVLTPPVIAAGGGSILLLFYLFMVRLSLRIPYLVITHVWNAISLEVGKTKSKLTWKEYYKRAVRNMIYTGFSFGLYIPYAKIAILKLKWSTRYIKIGDLDGVQAEATRKEAAIADEFMDSFDFEFELGL